MKIFHLTTPRHGWIDVTFGELPDAFTQTVSSVPNDCLRDLAAATARLLRHSAHEVVEFSLEPAFMTCELHRETDSVRLVSSIQSAMAQYSRRRFRSQISRAG